MTKVLCALSGIEFSVQHMSLRLTEREAMHPIFTVPTPKLLKLMERWLDQDMTDVENYLLYLALWNSTGLVKFYFPAIRTPETASIVASNISHLTNMVEIIHNASEDRVRDLFHLPEFVITPDTQDLSDSGEWIKIWQNCYKDYQNNYVTATAMDKMAKSELILERYIKDKTKDISLYAPQLARWAYDAGKFQIHANFQITNEKHQQELLSDYWKRIIVACARSESIWDIDETDLNELHDHCEEHIPHGDIFAHTLMSLLRSGISRRKSFTDLGSIDLGNGNVTFRILDAEASVEDANKLACIDSAPKEFPIEANYPNKLAFIKAKMNYRLAQEYKAQMEIREKVENANKESPKNPPISVSDL